MARESNEDGLLHEPRFAYFYSSSLLALEDYDAAIEACVSAADIVNQNFRCVFFTIQAMAYRSKKMFFKAGKLAVESLKNNANYPAAYWILKFLPNHLNPAQCAKLYLALKDVSPKSNSNEAELLQTVLIELAFGGELLGEGESRTRQLVQGSADKIAAKINGVSRSELIDEPDFIILGMPKCGTTSLFSFLMSRPDVVRPITKEMGYFSKYYSRGSEWYRSSFPHICTADGVRLKTGEASPGYIYSSSALDRIVADTSRTKFIIMTRDPVQRAVSSYYHVKKMHGQNLDIESFMAREIALGSSSAFLQKCNFSHYIKEAVSRFGEARVMVIDSESLFSDSSQLRSVLDFLGLNTNNIGKLPHSNKGHYQKPSDKMLGDLQAYFASE
ncbi:sulfotransferase domain-containing protein [uncultured Umboniibacter sp.]|uniref:sulfotransferase domain-containing protein n=1 Tax=uncultured Umboniibacter sp. TaxID=1798917 RepID=UPI00260DD54A|nr:sulfotransferase domain-containing protein [uncultured Umboniibacter sp.]